MDVSGDTLMTEDVDVEAAGESLGQSVSDDSQLVGDTPQEGQSMEEDVPVTEDAEVSMRLNKGRKWLTGIVYRKSLSIGHPLQAQTRRLSKSRLRLRDSLIAVQVRSTSNVLYLYLPHRCILRSFPNHLFLHESPTSVTRLVSR